MCGRYGRRADKQRIAEWFHTHNTDVFNDEYYEINSTRLAPSYNISWNSTQTVVRLDRDTGERVFWSLVCKRDANVEGSVIAKLQKGLCSAVADEIVDSELYELFKKSEWNQHSRSFSIASNFAPVAHNRFVVS